MTVCGLAENTKKTYVNSVNGLARHYRRSPDAVSTQEVQDYLIHIHKHRVRIPCKRGLSWQSCNCARHGIRSLYRITLGLPTPNYWTQPARVPSPVRTIISL